MRQMVLGREHNSNVACVNADVFSVKKNLIRVCMLVRVMNTVGGRRQLVVQTSPPSPLLASCYSSVMDGCMRDKCCIMALCHVHICL